MTRDDVMRETVRHTKRVGELMMQAVGDLQMRAVLHDESKFSADEFDSFAQETPNLRAMTYGSDEYKAALGRIQPAIQQHYSRNRHHPEHFKCKRCPQCKAKSIDIEEKADHCFACGAHGLDDTFDFGEMNLLDLIEMLADWKAATERHDDGDLRRSIDQNAERFGYGPETKRRLYLTAAALGWCY